MGPFTLDWMQLAAAFGAAQGLLLSVVLAAQRRNVTANRLLAALMVAFSLYLAASVYDAAKLVYTFPHFLGVPYQMPWVFGPLVYLYAVAASDRTWRVTPQTLGHFVPLAISLALAAPYYLMDGTGKIALFERIVAGDMPARLQLADPFKYVVGLGYSVATVLHLRRHRHRIEHSYSNLEHVTLTWLMGLSAAAFSIWLLATTLRVTDLGARLRDEHVSLAVALLVYAIGYLGLRQPEVFRQDDVTELPGEADPDSTRVAEPEPGAPPDADGGAAGRYERSGLSGPEAARLERQLMDIMARAEPWKESDLTLADLAGQLRTTPHKLSEVLNSRVGQTFYDFVNGYRVREVQRRIRTGEARALKMLTLAMDAGFASKSTFNQVFKKHTNQTPSAFREGVGSPAP